MTPAEATKQPTIETLVVDDRPDVALGLAMLLRRMGCTVQVAHHAHEALTKASDLHPDLIFLDIGLPDLSGHDVCKEVRQSKWGSNAFIVAVTGHNEPQDVIRSAMTGFDRHVGKPMELATLKEILDTVQTRTTLQLLNASSGEDPRSSL
jgi:two-component system CheB/CheR fusion protein